MPRSSPAIEEDDLVAPKRPWTRERFKAALMRRYNPRLHMSLILAASGFAAMIGSWSLLHLGVGSMLVRYPLAISLAYVTFLVGVWTWLRAMGFIDNAGRSRDIVRNLDGGDLSISGGGGSGAGSGGSLSAELPRAGGGTFDGGGASASWAQGEAAPMALVGKSGGGKGSGFSLGDGIDGDGLVLLLLALALVAVIFATSGYLIYCAPDVLTEAAFGAALAGTLTRASRRQSPNGWIAGVVRKTWAPYAVVLAVALVFAGFAAAHFPQATTFRQAIALALS